MTDNFYGPDEAAEKAVLTSMRAALDRIQADNRAKFTEFARLAGPPGMMALQLDLMNVRVFTLARWVLGENTRDLLQFQLDFEQQAGQMVDQAASQVRQAQLGAQLNPQAVQQMMQNGGLLGPDGKPLR